MLKPFLFLLLLLSSVLNASLFIAESRLDNTRLIQNEPVRYEESVEVELDFSVWWPKSGHLFELQFDEMNSFYFNFYPVNDDSSKISVNFNEVTLAEFFLLNESLSRFTNHHVHFTYRKNGSVSLVLNQDEFKTEVPAYNYSEVKFRVDPPRVWVPVVSMHYLSFTIDGKTKKDITFTKVDGSNVEKIFTIKNSKSFEGGGSVFVGFSTDNSRNKFIPFYNSTRILALMEPMALFLSDYLNTPPIMINANQNTGAINKTFHYQEKSETLYSFYPGLNPLIPVSENHNESDSIQIDTHHFGAGYAIDPVTEDLIMIGGYGHYTYKNEIYRYDFSDEKWSIFETSTSKPFHPRTPELVLPYDSTSIIIFGGNGNPTGKQGLPEFNYSDIWKLNLRTGQMRQLSEYTFDLENYDWIDGVFREADNSIYLFKTDTKNTSSVKLAALPVEIWKISLENPRSPEMIRTFETTPMVQNSMRYDDANDAIIYLLRPVGSNDNYKTVVLPFPILADERGSIFGFFGFLSVGLLILLLASFFYVYKRQKRLEVPPDIIFIKGKDVKIFISNEEIEFEGNSHTQPSRVISMLLDSPGFSVDHENLKKEFWEHVTESSFKNSLNVTLSTIRKNISPFGKVIQNRGGKVFLAGNFKVLRSRV